MPADGPWGWAGPLLVTAFAGFLRFWQLGTPRGYIFDEVYYAKDAWSLWRHGVELDATGTGPAFVVHPPLGKWLIAVGEGLFGNTEVGWRVAGAMAGTLSVLVLARAARRLTRSTLLGCVAGLLLACDGLEFVQSRTSMLDIFLMAFVLGAFACLLVDRDQARARLARIDADGARPRPPNGAGPHLGLRWWRIAAGLCLGAGLATKWSSAYYLVGFGLLAFAWDVGARRTAGVRRPFTVALHRDLPPLAGALAALPAAVYLLAWSGWFATSNGWDRHWAEGRSGAFAFVPAALRSWWHYHAEILHFHTTLTAGHPYQSHPIGWLLLVRPVLYFFTSPKYGEQGCGTGAGCVREVIALGTPAIWWTSIAALVATLWLWVAHRDWRAAAVLTGAAAGILPWFRDDLHHRTMFLFYALPALPFLVLALTLAVGLVLGPADAVPRRRWCGAAAAAAYVVLVVVNFFGLLPILGATVIPYASWHARMWFGTWI
jgi:dolichyl-phosphate-mannose-protein mannosyltransferase